MEIEQTPLPGVVLISPAVHGDERGFFKETFNAGRYAEAGLTDDFVQDNMSRSVEGTLRGLHFQEPNGQGKLVWVHTGSVFDVAVDIRRGSPTFGQWYGNELSAENHKQMWIPPGFAHGFCVTSPTADFVYKCTALYSPADEYSVRWDDPAIGIVWPTAEPKLSGRDEHAPLLADVASLPAYVT